MSEMHYDDQKDQDYYDRQYQKQVKSCLFSFKMLAILFVLYIIGVLLFTSCKAIVPPVTVATGTVISVDGDNVLVAFEVINKAKGSQGSNWFYCPKHFFKVGDTYPDSAKYQPIDR
ncbi:hypothetical protein [Algoriphagus resistens]|uniref:hypothetical protein n=1 Tax=Algoriphagus resistens TaxID=1750590 RepID=UPI000716B89A|nr:hypothetical protein [Algoriphagus resistens]